ncbi:MAG: hypothetical protein C7B46_18765 [Sulfobacillus benefaciens]|uniref:Uncharacterized protein n=1 Tax=Sulfobacillus benefaciens TaxID=453960 RepID=A0A2T2X3I5_9FIRM|nr:MAG: hypothetical protein C7B46_18765 [Sulfobacillus benefaciens]
MELSGGIIGFVSNGIGRVFLEHRSRGTLATADLDLAVGSGTDVALKTADVALLCLNFFGVVHALT